MQFVRDKWGALIDVIFTDEERANIPASPHPWDATGVPTMQDAINAVKESSNDDATAG